MQIEWSIALLVNAIVSEKITFFWKCNKILGRIHEKVTCFSLKEKSIKTFQFSVRSEWSVELLCKILISEKSLCFVSALRFYEEYNRNPHAFLLKKSSLFKHFNRLCKVYGVLHYFVNAVVSEKITLKSDLRFYEAFTRNSHAFLWKRSNLSKNFNSVCEVNEVWLYYENAVVPEKNHIILKVH